MPRSLETLLHDPSTPDIIRALAEAGIDVAQEGAGRYVEALEVLANACPDYYAMERLCAANQPMLVAFPASLLLLRKDRRQLGPWIRDLADTLRIAHNLHGVPAHG